MSTITTSATPTIASGGRTTSLRKKTFFIVAGILTTLIVILSVSLSWILVDRFSNVEMQRASDKVEVAGAALSAFFEPLRISGSDWSTWDASYQFVQDGNDAYKQANLTAFELNILQLDIIAYVQPDGHIMYGSSMDRDNKTLSPLPGSLIELLTANNLLVHGPSTGQKVSGFLALPQGTLLVVANPIVHDDGSGPSAGSLIIGRYLSPADVGAVQAEVGLKSLAFEPRSAPTIPTAMSSAVSRLAGGSTTVAQPVSSKLMLSSMLIPDVFGQPSFVLQAGVERSTHEQAQIALHYLVLALVVIGGIFLGLTLLLLERLVLRRLAKVSRDVRSIGSRRDPTMRLDPQGSDEIGQLASAINQMLQDLEDAQVREHRLNEQMAELHIQIDEARRDREVERITDSDYFRGLTERAADLRRRNARATNMPA